MVSTSLTFGLRPARMLGGAPNSGAMNEYKMSGSHPQTITEGDLVIISAGLINLPTSAVAISGSTLVGVFAGVQFTDSTTKRPVWSKQWVSAQAIVANTPVRAYVWDNPHQTYTVVADTSISAGGVGLLYGISNPPGDETAQVSRSRMHVSAVGNGVVRVLGIYDTPDNALSDAFPIVEVAIDGHLYS